MFRRWADVPDDWGWAAADVMSMHRLAGQSTTAAYTACYTVLCSQSIGHVSQGLIHAVSALDRVWRVVSGIWMNNVSVYRVISQALWTPRQLASAASTYDKTPTSQGAADFAVLFDETHESSSCRDQSTVAWNLQEFCDGATTLTMKHACGYFSWIINRRTILIEFDARVRWE
jgi:hypothetical protein